MTRALTIAILAFGLAYACLWWSFQRFYAPFGIAPQDVGLSPSGSPADLPGAALQLGVWMLIALALMAVLPTLCVFVLALGATWERKLVAVPVAASLAAATALVYWWLVDEWHGLITIAAAAAIFVLIQYVLKPTAKTLRPAAAENAEGRHGPDMTASSITRPPPRGLRARLVQIGADEDLAPHLNLAFAIFLAAAIVGIAFLDLPTDAAEAGECVVKQGRSVPSLNIPLPGLHLPILSVHAQPATLTWLSATPPSGIDKSNVVYLGQAGGSILVYDRTYHRTSRIPTGTAIVNIDPNAQECSGVH
jgi:hypothetical protein